MRVRRVTGSSCTRFRFVPWGGLVTEEVVSGTDQQIPSERASNLSLALFEHELN